MWRDEIEDAPNIVNAAFSIKSQLGDVLFDFGATHSFIFAELLETLRLVPLSKRFLLPLALPDWKTVRWNELFMDYPIQITSRDCLADLYKFKLADFDIILRLD